MGPITVRPRGRGGREIGVASDTLAGISREQWEDYKTRYLPLEHQLIAAYGNPADRARLESEAVGLTGRSFDTAAGVGARTLSRMGVSYDPSRDRGFGLRRVAAEVDALNMTRQHMKGRDELLLSGGLTSRGV